VQLVRDQAAGWFTILLEVRPEGWSGDKQRSGSDHSGPTNMQQMRNAPAS
jgi:hypothetical protein